MTSSPHAAPTDRIRWAGAAVLSASLFLLASAAFILLRPLLPIDETRYLTVAWEMWLGGSKLLTRLNGEIYSHKPPLLFWLMNLVWSITGVDGFGARMIGPLFGAVSVLLTAALARALWPDAPLRARNAAPMLATAGVFLLFGSLTMFDTLLTTAVLAAMLALVRLRQRPGRAGVAGLAAALALGVFAKGPVVLVHVLPVALLMPLWADPGARPKAGAWYRQIGVALLIAVGLVALWLGPALVLGGAEYRADVLWRQSAGRMVSSFAHDRPMWFYLALMPVFLWPWGWTPAGLKALAPRRVWADESGRLLAVWSLAALLAFSVFSGKQEHYLLPELPALALMLSAGSLAPASGRWRRIILLVPALVIFGLACLAASGQLSGLAAMGMTVPPANLALGGLAFILLAAGVWRSRSELLAVAAVAPATLLLAHLLAGPALWRGFDTSGIAGELAARESRGIAVMMPEYHGEFGFTGRLTAPVAALVSPEEVAVWAQAHPGGIVGTAADLSGLSLGQAEARLFRGREFRLYPVPDAVP